MVSAAENGDSQGSGIRWWRYRQAVPQRYHLLGFFKIETSSISSKNQKNAKFLLTRHSRTFVDFNYCTLYNFWDFGEVDPKNVDFLVTHSKSQKNALILVDQGILLEKFDLFMDLNFKTGLKPSIMIRKC